MALKKSQLYSSLWQSCDELRGGMDASQYKDYVLTLLFMKYVSDRHAGRPDALIDIPAGGDFADIAALKGRKDIGEQINVIVRRFAEANDLHDVIDQADFDDDGKLGSGKEMQDRLSRLVAIFEGLDFRANRAGGDDLLGDAYEYLMRHFATESGKSKGQFYTPAEVSRVIAQVVGIGPGTRQDQTIYDPTCGSGSLLLKAADQAPRGITVYGQEMDVATWALARMNMILHGHETAEVHRGNTLAAPHFKRPDGGLRTFDFAVANPPFSAKAWSNGLDPAHDEFRRFEYGVPPARNGDYAFLLHLVASLTNRGKGAIILPHGVLFRGNREADIRRNLVRRGLVKGIIGLPPNLFYGTGIPVSDRWVDAAKPRATIEDKHRKIKETPDLTIQRRRYKMDLVPPPLIAARWFADEQAEVDALRATHDEVVRALEALIEDHSSTADGDDGPLAATVNDRGRITKAAVTARVREVEADPESHDEMEPLLRCLALMDAEAAAGRAVKAAEVALDAQVLARYDTLTEAEIKILLVDDKWFATIHNAVKTQVNRATRRLAVRTKELERRYARPLPRLEREVDAFSAKVRCHLDHMGCSSESDVDSRSRLPTQSNPAHLNAQDDAATPT